MPGGPHGQAVDATRATLGAASKSGGQGHRTCKKSSAPLIFAGAPWGWYAEAVAKPSKAPAARDVLSATFGEMLLAAITATLAWSALGSSRLAQASGSGWIASFATSVALALIPMLVLVIVLRWAASAWSGLQPDAAKRTFLLCVLCLWAATCAVGLSLFGSILHAGTHHRGLGGATFGIVGALAALACGLVVLRACELVRGLLVRKIVAWAVAIVCAAVVLYVTRAATRDGAAGTAAAWWDALAGCVVAAMSSAIRIPWPYTKLATPASAGVFVLLVAIGMTTAPGVARAGGPVGARCPLLAPLLTAFGGSAQGAARPSAPTDGSASAAASAQPRGLKPMPVDPDEPPKKQGGDKPDIILVSLDSVRADHVGVYGSKRPTTASLDALAAQGCVFERAYAAGPETRTAITPLVTGKLLEGSAHDDRGWPTLLDSEITVAERLQKAGYQTAAIASFQWLSKERGFGQGFELFDETPFRKVHAERWSTSAHAVAQAIAAYDELAKKSKPVFLWVHLFDAHQKYLAHKEFPFGDEDVDRYDAEIALQDRELGRFVEKVQGGPRATKTVWIVHGTHGEAFGEHGVKGHAAASWDEITRVPMIVRVPWGASRRVSDPVSTLDIAATIADLAGVPRTGLWGQSLREMAEGAPPTEAGPAGVMVSSAGVPGAHDRDLIRAWIEPPLKLSVQGKSGAEKIALYDFAADPGETQDLSSSKPEEVKRLRGAMEAFIVGKTRN
jgi:choline-sulfatase